MVGNLIEDKNTTPRSSVATSGTILITYPPSTANHFQISLL